MEQREAAICQWFDMWLTKRDTGIRDLFAPDAVYIESWGPEINAISTLLFGAVLLLLIIINVRESRQERLRERARA